MASTSEEKQRDKPLQEESLEHAEENSSVNPVTKLFLGKNNDSEEGNRGQKQGEAAQNCSEDPSPKAKDGVARNENPSLDHKENLTPKKANKKPECKSSSKEEKQKSKPLTMEEKLALWRTQKRAKKVKQSRRLVNAVKNQWPPEKGDTFSKPCKPGPSFNHHIHFGSSISMNASIPSNSSPARRHSLCPKSSVPKQELPYHHVTTRKDRKPPKPKLKNMRTCSTQTMFKDKSSQDKDASVQTENVTLDYAAAETQTENDDMMADYSREELEEETTCLKFSNEVLIQQLDEAKRETNRLRDDEMYYSLRLQKKDEKLHEQEEKFREELKHFQEILKSGLERSVQEIGTLREEARRYKSLYYELLEERKEQESGQEEDEEYDEYEEKVENAEDSPEDFEINVVSASNDSQDTEEDVSVDILSTKEENLTNCITEANLTENLDRHDETTEEKEENMQTQILNENGDLMPASNTCGQAPAEIALKEQKDNPATDDILKNIVNLSLINSEDMKNAKEEVSNNEQATEELVEDSNQQQQAKLAGSSVVHQSSCNS